MSRKAREFPNDAATNEWLAAQKESTRMTYGVSFHHFLTFVKMTGDEILADRKNDKDYQWEKKVLASKQWGIEKGLAQNSAKTITTAARSFFAYHRLPLRFRRQESRRITEAHLKREDYRFSLDDLKKLSDIADLTEHYVVTAGKSFGLRAGDFLRLTRGDIEPYIDREVPISLGPKDTQKEGVKAYPFIDIDAQPVIKLMLEKMSRDGRTKPTDRMVTYSDEIQLTRVLKRLAKKAGLNTGSKVVRFHNLRKFLSDHLSSYMSSDKWKQIIGKTLSESAYISSESLRADYARAMPETCFSKNFGDLEKRLKEVEEIKKSLGPDMLKRMQDVGIRLRRKGKECEDGEHCEAQQIVEEENLAGFLSENWKVTAVLPSGKIVVQRA
jgi:integrase